MIRVKATREGLIGKQTATGWTIDTVFPYVALPSHRALGRWIIIRNVTNGIRCCAQVRDVGPFNTQDDSYVFQSLTADYLPNSPEIRPASELGLSVSALGTNNAGIDLGDAVWKLLDMKDNTDIEWEFV